MKIIAALLLALAPCPSFAAGNIAAKPSFRAGFSAAVVAPLQLRSSALGGLSIPSLTVPSAPLGAGPAAVPQAPAAILNNALAPKAALAAPLLPAAEAAKAARATPFESLKAQSRELSRTAPGPQDPFNGWSNGARSFDGARGGAAFIDTQSYRYRQLNGGERAKLDATVRAASGSSAVFRDLNSEFQSKGGYFVLDTDQSARFMSAAAVDRNNRPVIVLTWDLLNRYNGKWEEIYRGAPWEFIAASIAREQVFFNGWYANIPASAEKLAISMMNMVRVFVELTDGKSNSWATDKDFQATQNDSTSYLGWNWFEQLVIASRDAARGVGGSTGHLIESKFFLWARDWVAAQPEKAGVKGFKYALWEQFDGKYYRPGDAKNGQPLPADAPRIDQAAYDQASYTVYGADGKGSAQNGTADSQTVFGWIIQWLKARFEV